MKKFAPLVLVLFCGCASDGDSASAFDYAQLLKDATPTFTKGECGPQLTWTKNLQVHDKVEIEGVVVVKTRCTETEAKED